MTDNLNTSLPDWARGNQIIGPAQYGSSHTNYNTGQGGYAYGPSHTNYNAGQGSGYGQQMQYGGGSQFGGGQNVSLPNWAHANPQGSQQGNTGPSHTNYNTGQGGYTYGPSHTNYNAGQGSGYGQQMQYGGGSQSGGGQNVSLPNWAHANPQGLQQGNTGPSYTDYNTYTPGPGPR